MLHDPKFNVYPGNGGVTLSPESLDKLVKDQNEAYADKSAEDVLRAAIQDPALGRIALVSSFGAESAVLLHMAAQIDKSVPVIFLDTELLFDETLVYQSELTKQLGLWNVRIIRPDEHELAARDPCNDLNERDTDACCALRKTRPLNKALEGFGGWITGRKRFQAGTRAELTFFEADRVSGRIKVNPLAKWTKEEVKAYMDQHDLPRHPLVAKGFPSIGCSPCTSAVKEGEDERAGRWRGQDKIECGIHFAADGKIVREGQAA